MNTTSTMLDDYKPDAKPGWAHTNNGHHVFDNPNFGTLEIGQVPGKSWDQWLFHENHGGGVMAIGVTYFDGELLVLTIKANRFNLKGDQDDIEAAGGFQDGDETALKGALRELYEETGIKAELIELPGRLFVGNRAFFQVNGEHEGTKGFYFLLDRKIIDAIKQRDDLVLLPWQTAICVTRDALTGMLIGRVVAHLL